MHAGRHRGRRDRPLVGGLFASGATPSRAKRALRLRRPTRNRQSSRPVLHCALDQAVAWRLIERNPATGAALPRRSRPEMPLAPDEARRFLAEAHGHPLEALFTLAVT